MKFATVALFLSAAGQSLAFAPSSSLNLGSRTGVSAASASKLSLSNDNKEELAQFEFPANDEDSNIVDSNASAPLAAFTAIAATAGTPLAAHAAGTGDAIPSAIAAYVHYLSLFAIVGAVTYERSTIAAGMDKETEDSVALADITLGISGTTLLVSGYYRAVEYGKGWYFYSHEPIFWAKMVALCIFGAASFFPTATIIKRAVPVATGKKEFEPMSEKLATRMKKVLNAEIVMLGSIPLLATLMSRGVGYTESIPVQYIGPALCAVTIGGLGYKYINEALTWSDDDAGSGSSGSSSSSEPVINDSGVKSPLEKLQETN